MWFKVAKTFLIALCVLAVIFAVGPQPEYPRYDLSPVYLKVQLQDLDSYVAAKEAKVLDLKPDNEARIIWANDSKRKTPYSLVYLHGFSASHKEGDNFHKPIAQKYGMNLYLSRLADHGRADENSFKGITPKDLIESAKHAIAVGALIGEKVILMSCSTGGTFSVMLSAEDSRIAGMVMYSPNIGLADPMAQLVTYPWGKQLLKKVMDGEHTKFSYEEEQAKYWNETYHIDGIVALQSIIDDGMRSEYFNEISVPVYLACYYQDESNQDQIVSVADMDRFFSSISTPNHQKMMIKSAEVGRHVFTTSLWKSDCEKVVRSTNDFMEQFFQ